VRLRNDDILKCLEGILNVCPSLDNDKFTILNASVRDRIRPIDFWIKLSDAFLLLLQQSDSRLHILSILSKLQFKGCLANYQMIILMAILIDIKIGTGDLSSASSVKINQAKNCCIYICDKNGDHLRTYSIPENIGGCKEIYEEHCALVVARVKFFDNIAIPEQITEKSLKGYLAACTERVEKEAGEATARNEKVKKKSRGKRARYKQFSLEQHEWLLHFGASRQDEFHLDREIDPDEAEARRDEYLSCFKESSDEVQDVFLFVVDYDNWNRIIVSQKRFRLRLSITQARFYLYLSSLRRPYGQTQVIGRPVQKFAANALKTFLSRLLELTNLNSLSKRMIREESALKKQRLKALIEVDLLNPDEGMLLYNK
jgi:hypothetical protein